MIEAVIFDMDGLLIDSEPLWVEAEVEVFGAVGVPLTPARCAETTGLRIDEVVRYWHERFPWESPSPGVVEARLIEQVIGRVRARGTAKAGVAHALEASRSRGAKVALASSSPPEMIAAVLERLDLASAFDAVRSAVAEPYGKPHPSVFLTTAGALSTSPTRCLVFEDSLAGVLAAKSARMFCVCVPERFPDHDPRLVIADAILGSLEEIEPSLWTRFGRS